MGIDVSHGRTGATIADDGPEHSAHDSAVDLSLVDDALSMTVIERLRQNDRMLQTILRLRKAFRERDGLASDDGPE